MIKFQKGQSACCVENTSTCMGRGRGTRGHGAGTTGLEDTGLQRVTGESVPCSRCMLKVEAQELWKGITEECVEKADSFLYFLWPLG